MPFTEITEAWLAHLQENGYRITEPRRVVVEIVATSSRVLSPLEVFDLARRQYPRLGLVTVYRTIDKLEDLALIQRVHQPSGCQAFISAVPDHQHLLICESCGRAEFFGGDKLEPLINDVANGSGFSINDHWLQLFGVCGDCQRSNSAPS